MSESDARSAVTTQLNPGWLDPSSYVAFLNRGFPGEWDRVAYDWYAARAFNGVHSELLVRAQGSRILSGMTLCYRQIDVDARHPIDVCVLSAGATLSTERGRGHYRILLQAALERSREKSCAAVLGFVTRDNSSGRGLVRLGARSIPSYYIVSADRPRIRCASRARALASRPDSNFHQWSALDSVLALSARSRVDLSGPSSAQQARFHYEHVEDWEGQFIHRPHAVRAIHLAHDSLALVESVRATDRLQWLACPDGKTARCIAALATASAVAGRDFFMYTLDPHQAAVARRVGLRIRAGYLMVLPTGHSNGSWDRLANAVWRVQSGDRL